MISNPSNSLEWMIFLAQKYSSMFIKGTWLTLYISVVGTLLGFVLGYIVGIVNDVKLNDGDNIVKKVLIRIVKVIFTVYVEVFRDTPMIVQAMIVYYGIRQMGYETYTCICRYSRNCIKYRCLHGRDSQSRNRFNRYGTARGRMGHGNVTV